MKKIDLISKHTKLRLVGVEDAEFIRNLRTHPSLKRYISETPSSLDVQINWIKNYKKRESYGVEFYFIIENFTGEKFGTLRLYNILNNQFTWGSWLIKPNSPIYTSIESMLLIYIFAFEHMVLEKANIDVKKENKEVVLAHKKFGALMVGENEEDVFFELTKERFFLIKKKYHQYC